MDKLYQQIIDIYNETGSVKQTAEELETYAIKVRRVLITEGLWHSKTSDKIAGFLEKGLSVAEIAQKLAISEKSVQSYMPYSRGQYGGENRSGDAIRSEEYRGRMQTAAKNLVTNTEAKSKRSQEIQEELHRTIEELKAEKERLLAAKRNFWDNVEAGIKRMPQAMQLHMELDTGFCGEEFKEVMRRYGKMEKTVSRDIIVPGKMTLHGLHYAIMKSFGWQNSHLHSYEPDEVDFKKMTNGGQVKEWVRQVGMYFRFPSDDYDDIYWDDDYEEDMSFKTWLKNKYTGPYIYDGIGEHYIPAQREVDDFLKRFPEIKKKTTEQRDWNVLMEGKCEELLERNMLSQVLLTPDRKANWDEWKTEKATALMDAERSRRANIQRYTKLDTEMRQLVGKLAPYYNGEIGFTEKMKPAFREMDKRALEMEWFLCRHNPVPSPIMSSLVYRYDYGDGWEIRITCTNAWYDKSIYARSGEGDMIMDRNNYVAEKYIYRDAFGKLTSGEEMEQIMNVIHRQRPVCIAWDGINLVDDVGGVGGFCKFLETINGIDQEQKRSYKEWAKSLGWTGRMSRPENIL